MVGGRPLGLFKDITGQLTLRRLGHQLLDLFVVQVSAKPQPKSLGLGTGLPGHFSQLTPLDGPVFRGQSQVREPYQVSGHPPTLTGHPFTQSQSRHGIVNLGRTAVALEAFRFSHCQQAAAQQKSVGSETADRFSCQTVNLGDLQRKKSFQTEKGWVREVVLHTLF